MSLLAEVVDVFFNWRKPQKPTPEGLTHAQARSETIKDIVLRSPCKVRIGAKYYLITSTEVEK